MQLQIYNSLTCETNVKYIQRKMPTSYIHTSNTL